MAGFNSDSYGYDLKTRKSAAKYAEDKMATERAIQYAKRQANLRKRMDNMTAEELDMEMKKRALLKPEFF